MLIVTKLACKYKQTNFLDSKLIKKHEQRRPLILENISWCNAYNYYSMMNSIICIPSMLIHFDCIIRCGSLINYIKVSIPCNSTNFISPRQVSQYMATLIVGIAFQVLDCLISKFCIGSKLLQLKVKRFNNPQCYF